MLRVCKIILQASCITVCLLKGTGCLITGSRAYSLAVIISHIYVSCISAHSSRIDFRMLILSAAQADNVTTSIPVCHRQLCTCVRLSQMPGATQLQLP